MRGFGEIAFACACKEHAHALGALGCDHIVLTSALALACFSANRFLASARNSSLSVEAAAGCGAGSGLVVAGVKLIAGGTPPRRAFAVDSRTLASCCVRCTATALDTAARQIFIHRVRCMSMCSLSCSAEGCGRNLGCGVGGGLRFGGVTASAESPPILSSRAPLAARASFIASSPISLLHSCSTHPEGPSDSLFTLLTYCEFAFKLRVDFGGI